MFKSQIVTLFTYLVLSLIWTSCIESPSSPFHVDSSENAQVFRTADIQNAKCKIQTEGIITQGSASFAKQITQNPAPFSSISFIDVDSKKMKTENLSINSLPQVRFKVKGSDLCQKLLGKIQIRLLAKPKTEYDILFQITSSSLKVLLVGEIADLPHQQQSAAISIKDSTQKAIPLGGYTISQGSVKMLKNIDNQDIHIQNFYENSDESDVAYLAQGIPHSLKSKSSFILVSNINKGFQRFDYINKGFQRFHYINKKDTFLKSYFQGVWYASTTIEATEPIFASQYEYLFPGANVSGNNYKGFNSGQKVFFKFESSNLKVLNYNFQNQAVSALSSIPAEAEVLSIPIQHVDFRDSPSDTPLHGELGEELNEDLLWSQKKYAEISFTHTEHIFSKLLGRVLDRYNIIPKSSSLSLEGIQFSSDYFYFTVYDGYLKYRFSFRRQAPSQYQPKYLSTADRDFSYLYISDQRISPNIEESFKTDLEKEILIMRVHPNKNKKIILNFSNITSKDPKVRDIGRQAVALWNQALEKAQLEIRLKIDESKDVPMGDNRYHILSLITDQNRLFNGVSSVHVDDETGEIIASSSNVVLSTFQNSLKYTIIRQAYSKWNIHYTSDEISSHPDSTLTQTSLMPSGDLSASSLDLNYFTLRDYISKLLVTPTLQIVEDFKDYNQFLSDQKENLIQDASWSNLDNKQTSSPQYKKWIKQLRIPYALHTGRFIETESASDISKNLSRFRSEKWNTSEPTSSAGHIAGVISEVCPSLPHPLKDPEVFKTVAQECADQIFPIYALGTTVHELGHSVFSLNHNFSGSTDPSNFVPIKEFDFNIIRPYLLYTDADNKEKSQIDLFKPLSSSVMDYISLEHGARFTPGLYDISAIRQLYSEYSTADASPEEVRSYSHCSNESANSHTYCMQHSVGQTPEEITKHEVQFLFHSLNSVLYSKNITSQNDDPDYALRVMYRSLSRLITIYQDWRKRLSVFSKIHTKKSILKLSTSQFDHLTRQIIKLGSSPSSSDEEKELLSFYKARNLIYHALTYISFLPNRYCILTDKSQVPIRVELSKINDYIQASENFTGRSLISCFAEDGEPRPEVQNYIQMHHDPNTKVIDEVGYFLNDDVLPRNSSFLSLNPSYFRRYRGSSIPRILSFTALALPVSFLRKDHYVSPTYEQFPLSMMNEPDIREEIERLILLRSTRGAFYPQDSFFESIQDVELEKLTPAQSSSMLFSFPEKKQHEDLLLRDSLFNPGFALAKNSEGQSAQFSQNFQQESQLLTAFNSLYSIARSISTGFLSADITESSREDLSHLNVIIPTTTPYLLGAQISHLRLNKIIPKPLPPSYFQIANLTVMSGISHNESSLSSIILRELSYNSLSHLFWLQENIYSPTEGTDKRPSPLTAVIYKILDSVFDGDMDDYTKYFYMTYVYTLSLAYLDIYDIAVTKYDSQKLIHGFAHEKILKLIGSLGTKEKGFSEISALFSKSWTPPDNMLDDLLKLTKTLGAHFRAALFIDQDLHVFKASVRTHKQWLIHFFPKQLSLYLGQTSTAVGILSFAREVLSLCFFTLLTNEGVNCVERLKRGPPVNPNKDKKANQEFMLDSTMQANTSHDRKEFMPKLSESDKQFILKTHSGFFREANLYKVLLSKHWNTKALESSEFDAQQDLLLQLASITDLYLIQSSLLYKIRN